MLVLITNTILYYSIIISYHIILYIIKVGLIRHGCATWLHQIAEILLNFYIFLRTKKE